MLNRKVSTIFRKSLVCLMIIGLLFTNISPGGGMLEAYAAEALAGCSENGYVTDIDIPVSSSNPERLENYTFSSTLTDYNVVLPDTRMGGIHLTVSDEAYEQNTLYYSVYVDGVEKKKATEITAQTTPNAVPMAFATQYGFKVGSEKTLSIKVGTRDASGEYTSADVYNYTISRSINIRSGAFQVKDADGTALPLTPEFNSAKHPYTREFSTVYSGEEISLNITPATTGAEVYVGESVYANGTAVKLEDYTSSGSEIVVIPITLKYNGLETKYTLNVSKQDFSPVITQQPTPASVEKGADSQLKVEASLPTESGNLSYQWYKVSGLQSTEITGETAASYQPPTNYAGTSEYKCVVTNIVEGIPYSVSSDVVKYEVNLSYLTAPEFVLQPQQSLNSNGGSRVFLENGTPEIEVGPIMKNGDKYIEDVEYQLNLYRNSVNSTEGGEKIVCEVTSSTLSSANGKSYKLYSFQLPSQSVTGTWYYYVTATVSKDGYEDAVSVSETLPLTFKKATEIVKGLEGDGSEVSPFLIYDVEDLIYVKGLVEGEHGSAYNFAGQTLAFANDITLPVNWQPIGNLKTGTSTEKSGVNIQPFSGTIDGKGYTLTVADHGKSLLNYARKATVKNLNIAGTHIDGYGLVETYTVDYGETGVYVNDPVKLRTIDIENVTIKSGTKILKSGFIGGFASGANAVNIRNCTVEAGVEIGYNKDQSNIGSFAGEFNGTIENCVSKATVYGIDSVGGFIGNKGQSIGPCNIVNSSFQGTVTASGTRVGGIAGAGYISGSAPGTPMVQIHNCFVAADITGKDEVGGIIGSEKGHCNNVDEGDAYGIKGTLSISDTFYYGKLNSEGTNVGGTIGYLHDFTKKTGDATNYYLEGCGASNGIGGVVEGEISGAERYSVSATVTEFSDGTVLGKLNSSESGYKNWLTGENHPVLSDEAIVTSLSIDGEYKTTYILGEDIDLDGMQIIANKSDGSKLTLTVQDVEITGYNKSTRGIQTVTVKYGAVSTEFDVTVLLPEQPGQSNEITVYFTLLGDTVHDSEAEGATVHTLSSRNLSTWSSYTGYRVNKNSTVLDVLEKVLDEKGWSCSSSGAMKINLIPV